MIRYNCTKNIYLLQTLLIIKMCYDQIIESFVLIILTFVRNDVTSYVHKYDRVARIMWY